MEYKIVKFGNGLYGIRKLEFLFFESYVDLLNPSFTHGKMSENFDDCMDSIQVVRFIFGRFTETVIE